MDARRISFTCADLLFDAALDLPPGERASYLAAACGDDLDLLRLVEELLEDDLQDSLLASGEGLSTSFLDLMVRQPEVDPLSAGTAIGPYRVVKELGRGGMAVVYLAERAQGPPNHLVAVKQIKAGCEGQQTVERFAQEWQILDQVRHPNIPRFLDDGLDSQGRPFFAMEWIEGRPIDRYADDEGCGVRRRLELVLQVARAVECVHDQGLVHRDIKPANILVTGDGNAKLLDFGIAQRLDPGPGSAEATSPGRSPQTWDRLMTPAYASPEQVRGEAVTPASDVYQLGLLLYLLLTGRWPYRWIPGEAVDVVRAICEDVPTRPSVAVGTACPHSPDDPATGAAAQFRRQLRGDLDAIVLKALRKEPQQRYASMAELIHDLEAYLDGGPSRAPRHPLLRRVGRLVSRCWRAVAPPWGRRLDGWGTPRSSTPTAKAS